MSNRNDEQAQSIINAALGSGEISRTNFNIARRTGVLMSDGTRTQWIALNDAIFNQTVKIVEDGDMIYHVPLSLDKAGHVVETF